MRCDATDCAHNEQGQCNAPDMYVDATACCATYKPTGMKEEMPEEMMGGPGGQMDKALY